MEDTFLLWISFHDGLVFLGRFSRVKTGSSDERKGIRTVFLKGIGILLRLNSREYDLTF